MFRYLLIALALVLVAGKPASSQPAAQSGPIEVKGAWARATAGGSMTGAAYVMLSNSGSTGDRLVSVSTPAAGRVELHTMTMEGDVMRMRQIQGIEIQPGSSVELKPGGLHIMLLDLKGPLKVGDRFPLTLMFEKSGTETVDVDVRAIGATGPAAPMHH